MWIWAAAILSLASFVSAAKTHGRQLRLERELRGHVDVHFGTGTNPPFVEALWRRDRIRFWILTPSLMVVAALLAVLAPILGVPLPFARHTEHSGLVVALLGTLLWAPTVAFLTLAALSQSRLRRDKDGPLDPPPTAAWRESARRGTLFWAALTVSLVLGVVALAVL